jgi:ferric-dicitrate binding protein FerR (iron transport regulator)
VKKDSPIERLLSKYFDQIQNSSTINTNFTDFDEEKSLAKIHKHINKKSINLKWVVAAASLFIICGISFFTVKNSYQPSSENLLVEQTGIGKIKQIILPDGTKVWLNAKSELKYDKDFNKKIREVNLSGEAYFEVNRDEGRPFIINSHDIRTTVLGTSFNVSAYQTDADLKVSVISGKVSVQQNENQVLLTKDQQAVYNKAEQRLSQNPSLDASENILWKEGKLLFSSTTLEKVVADIQRKYETRITINEKIKGCMISADFTDMPMEKIIKILGEIVNGSSSFKNNTYYLTGNGCS